jgi:pimeloyl-ACP methyl ester carboxylesterase
MLLTAAHFSFSQTIKNDTTMTKSKTIVFIHGLFVNPTSWNEWKTYFESKGYTCYTPAYPYHEGAPADLRNNINPNLAKVDFEEVVMKIAGFIDSLPEKPIVIGHSLGGLVVQKLVEINKVARGISIDGGTPKNVFPTLRTVRSMFPVINPFKGKSVFITNKKWFHNAFCSSLTRKESDTVFDEIAVPESRQIPRATLNKQFAKINFNAPHQPLLFIGGEIDKIIPARLTKKNASAYKDKNSITEFKEFKGRSHYICGQDGWQEVADYILNWLK